VALIMLYWVKPCIYSILSQTYSVFIGLGGVLQQHIYIYAERTLLSFSFVGGSVVTIILLPAADLKYFSLVTASASVSKVSK
jgi:hypothetical protein